MGNGSEASRATVNKCLCERERLAWAVANGPAQWNFFPFLTRLSLAPFWQAERPPLPSTQESSVLTSTHILFQKATEANAFVADRPTPFQPRRWKPFHEPHNGSSSCAGWCSPRKVHNFHYVASTYGMYFPSQIQMLAELFVQHWDWQGAGGWQESWGIFLWALVSWPVELSPVIVPRFCQIKQGEIFSRCLVTKRWGREGTSWIGGGTQVPAKATAQETPNKGPDPAPWNVQWPPETLPFRQMPGTQAILILVRGLDLSTLCDWKSNSLEHGVSIFIQLIPFVIFSILSSVGPTQEQSRRLLPWDGVKNSIRYCPLPKYLPGLPIHCAWTSTNWEPLNHRLQKVLFKMHVLNSQLYSN